MTCKELLETLKAHGWEEITQKRSYLQLKHPAKIGKITIPVHSGDIPLGTLFNIKTGWSQLSTLL
ncbi:YcfA-like protein [compost metagenome]|uniref:Putative periplasmic or secreted lipoprotein n=1 Tax=Solitalea canadensis (strain ATCC 29591 / DSM 3403 / JCM 21819 / LMG 8368 / NBRC 15130 / NCIMB 12057 / USAM 9D) TaxID=929556 RepID=H8KUS7_SOLCM|nr:type II toxin-antitoxin system HicA family toxin [Solitalea canadensis]AFD07561.1 putative periplasmic or secreted lipoprotein [Solitalea canadensis DSM 3403]